MIGDDHARNRKMRPYNGYKRTDENKKRCNFLTIYSVIVIKGTIQLSYYGNLTHKSDEPFSKILCTSKKGEKRRLSGFDYKLFKLECIYSKKVINAITSVSKPNLLENSEKVDVLPYWPPPGETD